MLEKPSSEFDSTNEGIKPNADEPHKGTKFSFLALLDARRGVGAGHVRPAGGQEDGGVHRRPEHAQGRQVRHAAAHRRAQAAHRAQRTLRPRVRVTLHQLDCPPLPCLRHVAPL